jgi:hypothetical protein
MLIRRSKTRKVRFISTHSRLCFASKYSKNKVYSALMILNEHREVLLNPNNIMPSIELADKSEESTSSLFDDFSVKNEDFVWIKTTCLDWEPTVSDVVDTSNSYSFTLASLLDRFHDSDVSSFTSLKVRKRFHRAAIAYLSLFRLKDLGYMAFKPIYLPSHDTYITLNVVYIPKDSIPAESLKKLYLRWQSTYQMNPLLHTSYEHSSLWNNPITYLSRQSHILKPGLYLCAFLSVVSLKGVSTIPNDSLTC